MRELYRTVLRRRVRLWLYALAAAVLALLAVYGVLTGEQVLAWAGVFAALFAVAADNTSGSEYPPRHAADDDA